jgi:hypothetical protein
MPTIRLHPKPEALWGDFGGKKLLACSLNFNQWQPAGQANKTLSSSRVKNGLVMIKVSRIYILNCILSPESPNAPSFILLNKIKVGFLACHSHR